MTIPDSLQMISDEVFDECHEIAPASIYVNDNDAVFAYLRSQQSTSTIQGHDEEGEDADGDFLYCCAEV